MLDLGLFLIVAAAMYLGFLIGHYQAGKDK